MKQEIYGVSGGRGLHLFSRTDGNPIKNIHVNEETAKEITDTMTTISESDDTIFLDNDQMVVFGSGKQLIYFDKSMRYRVTFKNKAGIEHSFELLPNDDAEHCISTKDTSGESDIQIDTIKNGTFNKLGDTKSWFMISPDGNQLFLSIAPEESITVITEHLKGIEEVIALDDIDHDKDEEEESNQHNIDGGAFLLLEEHNNPQDEGLYQD